MNIITGHMMRIIRASGSTKRHVELHKHEYLTIGRFSLCEQTKQSGGFTLTDYVLRIMEAIPIL